MPGPHVHVPFEVLRDHTDFIKSHRLNLEIFFSSGVLDGLGLPDVEKARDALDYGPSFTIHAPFMDLSPGAVDQKVRDITRHRFIQVFEIAQVLRPRAIVFHSGYEKWKYAHKVEVWLEGSVKMWREFRERAAELGTVIAIENIFEDSPANLELLMKELGSPAMGICFDTGHFNLFSKEPLSAWLEGLAPHIVELHLHDNDKGYDSHLAIGDGSFDFNELFKSLKGGREVIHTIEAHSPEDVLRSLERLEHYRQRMSF